MSSRKRLFFFVFVFLLLAPLYLLARQYGTIMVCVGVILEQLAEWLFAKKTLLQRVSRNFGAVILISGLLGEIAHEEKLRKELIAITDENTRLRKLSTPRVSTFREDQFKKYIRVAATKPAIEVIYPSQDVETYNLANAIVKLLKEENWQVDGPRPVQESDALPLRPDSTAPLIVRAGAGFANFAIVAQITNVEPTSPAEALRNALFMAIEGMPISTQMGDPRLPSDRLRLVLSSRESTGIKW
jgi:hypothetical protein